MLDSRRSSTLIALSKGAAATTLAVGAAAMFGWALGIPTLKSMSPDLVTMKANAALCFILLGIGLLLAHYRKNHPAARIMGGLVTIIGLLTLCQYIFGWEFHIDQLLFREPDGAVGTVVPGRMAPNTAFCFVMIGLALVFLDSALRSKYDQARILAAPALLVGSLTLIGYAYGVADLEGIGEHTVMALPTALALVIFSLGLMIARPEHGITVIMTSDSPGSAILRTMLPVTLVVILGMGFCIAWGEKAHLFQATTGTALFAVLVMIVLIVRSVMSATALHLVDAERRLNEEQLREQEARYHATLDRMMEGCQIIDFDWRYIYMNDAGADEGRWRKEDLVGRTMMEAYPDIVETELFSRLRQCMENRTVERFENQVTYPSGSIGWFELSVQPSPEGIFILSLDITERKKAEEALRSLASFPEEDLSPVLRIGDAGEVLYANGTALFVMRAIGWSSGEAIPDILASCAEKARDTGKPARVEVTLPSGKVMLFNVVPITDEGYVNLYGMDITERREAEKALLLNQERLALALSSARMATFEWDIVNNKRTWSDDMHLLLGTTPENFSGSAEEFFSVIHTDDRGAVQSALTRATETPAVYEMEYRVVWPDASVHHISARGMVYRDDAGQPVHMAGVCWDITERKLAEEELRRSQNDLKTAQAVAHIGSWRMDVQRNMLEWSEENHRIFGVPDGGEMTYETFLATVHQDDREYVNREWSAALRGEPYDIDHRIVVGGTVKWVRERADLEFDSAGNLIGGFGTTQDITDRKTAEAVLRQRTEELQTVMDAVPTAIFIARDAESKVITGNQAARELLEVPEDANMSKSATENERPTGWQEMRDGVPISPEDLPLQQAASGKEVHDYEMDVVFNDGTVRSVLGNAVPLRDEDGNPRGGVAALTDITERKKAEKALKEEQDHKMEFYRSTIGAATDGKLVIAERSEIMQLAGPIIASWDLKAPEDVGVVRHGIEEKALSAGMDETRRGHLALSVGEATTNAVKNAGQGKTSLHRIDDTFIVVVSDSGSGIPALTLPSIALKPGFSTAGTLGMGYKMMIRFSDKVYLATGPEGTTVAIEMSLSPSEEPSDMGWMASFAGGIP